MTAQLHSGTAAPDAVSEIQPLGHVPALDGIRALAVAIVLLYHGDMAGFGGGFLGVSVFFTLSGFLITSLLLREWHTNARIDLRRFWSRRFRRLLPASWLTIALVLVAGALGVWDTEQLRSLQGDVPWSLAELVNWHFIASGTSYGDAFTAPSPLEHFWSLAIEQQFYIVLPAIVVGLLALGRSRGRHGGTDGAVATAPGGAVATAPGGAVATAPGGSGRRLGPLVAVLATLTVASAVANGLLARDSVDRAYFGTDTRAAELLLGALLACALLRRVQVRSTTGRSAVLLGGGVGLVVLAGLVVVAEVSSPWLYPWGLLLSAVATSAVILAALQPGAVAAVLAATPLPALGAISYGVYLLHFPIFLWLTPTRTGWDGFALFGLRVVVTLFAAIAMFRLVERPVRSGSRLRTPTVRVALPLAAAALLAGTLWVTSDLEPPPDFLQPREEGAVEIREVPTITTTTTTTAAPSTAAPDAPPPPPPPPSTTAPPPIPPSRVLLVGDSVAASIEDALGDALVGRGISYATAAAPGCGVLTGDPADAQGNELSMTAACSDVIPGRQRDAVAEVGPDLVVAMSLWESGNRVVDGVWHPYGTPEADAVLRRLYGEMLDRLSVGGATVALVTIPHTVDSANRPANPDANRRADILNRILAEVVADNPDRAILLRLDDIVCPSIPCPPVVEGVTLRPADGAHFDAAPGARFAAERFADRIAAVDLRAR